MSEPVHHVYDPEPALPLSADCGLIAWTLIGTSDAARVTCPECRDVSPWLYPKPQPSDPCECHAADEPIKRPRTRADCDTCTQEGSQ